MKKFLPFFLAVFLFSSCQKDPDMSDLDGGFVAYTNYDKSANFSSFSTYYLPDSIMVIGPNDSSTKFWEKSDNPNAQKVLAAIVQNMNDRGYTRNLDKATADLGLQVTFVNDVSYFVDYWDYPYWWWGYPYYWDPTYWGWWDGWYYPFPIVYSYSVGSLITEMVDLHSGTPNSDPKLKVIWNSNDAGLLTGDAEFDGEQAVTAINESFAQSPYIKK